MLCCDRESNARRTTATVVRAKRFEASRAPPEVPPRRKRGRTRSANRPKSVARAVRKPGSSPPHGPRVHWLTSMHPPA